MLNFLLDKRGNLSIFRISLAILGLGILLVIIAFIVFQLEMESLRSPLSVELPEDAQLVAESPSTSGSSRTAYYRVPNADADQIAAFYNQQLLSFSGNQPDQDGIREECNRRPPVGNFPDYEIGESPIAFEWQCFFGRNSLGGEHYTIVKIWPPFIDEGQPLLSSETDVIVEYQQQWQP